jgi:hypothetical protein
MQDPDGWNASATISSEHIDITAEETCPAPTVQLPAQEGARQRTADLEAAQAPSATTFKLMNQLEALAADLAVRERDSYDARVENDHDESDLSAGLQDVEPSIRVTPRPSGFEHDPFADDRRSIGRRALSGLFIAVLVGAGGAFAWQTYPYRVRTMPPSIGADVAAEQRSSAPSVQAPASSTALSQSGPVAPVPAAATAPATSPELAKQLEAMVQDLALVRRGVEQLTAKQEQLAAAQQQLEQLAAKQQQLAAKQDQMAQNIAKLQTREQNVRQRVAASPPSRAAPLPPRAPPEPAPQISPAPAPRSEPHPLPPLPIPP